MQRLTASIRDAFRHGFDTLLPLPVVIVLHHYGWAGHVPLGVVLAFMLASSVIQRPDVQLRLAGGDLGRRVGLRVALHVGLSTTVVLYSLGWGPLLIAGYAVSALPHVRWSGSRAWRPAVAAALAGIVAGQLGIATGLVHSYLEPVQAAIAGVAGAFLVGLLVRQFGLLTEQCERADDLVQVSEQRFRALVQYSSDMTVVIEPDGNVRYVSPAVQEMLGMDPEDLTGRPFAAIMAAEDAHRARLLNEELILGTDDAVVRTEMRFLHRDGSVRWHHVTFRNLLANPAVHATVANHRDVTEEKFAQEKLEYDASHDVLTGLDNRAAFAGDLAEALARARYSGEPVAVLFIDLDGFKQVNDTLGHEAGDVVLMNVASVLRQHVLGSDVIGRLGGDEFAVALPRIRSIENAEVVAQRILQGLAEPVPVAGHNLVAVASVGVALTVPADEEIDAQELIRRADLAMYDAKRGRGARWAHYHPGLEPASRITAEEIRISVEDGQLFLLYQPIVSLKTGYLVAVEALVRWNHPVRGLVSPTDFIPIAEETGLIGLVGEWVLRTACAQQAAWQAELPLAQGLKMGVNVAADQLEDVRTAGLVAGVLQEWGLSAKSLVVEVTESALADSPAARATLEALHESGIRIAIDDFGTGYSSLQYLTRLPADVLKLDRGFVAELDGTPEGSAIAEAVVRLAQTLHLSTTAEGVETLEQAAELAALGYANAQGYLFAKPLPPDQIAGMLGRLLFTRPELPVPVPGG